MQLLTGGPSLDQKLSKLIEKHDHVAFAVAWASTGTATYKAILRHRSKIQRAVVGTHFYQTAPDVLDDFVGDKKVRFMLQPAGVFHPKAFFFWTADEWDLFVGSANLTAGAMGKNSELVMHASSSSAPSRLTGKIQRQIKEYWDAGQLVSKTDAARYRALWEINRPPLKRLDDNYGAGKSSPSPVKTEIMSMSWSAYHSAIRKRERTRHLERRDLLECFAEEFRAHSHYKDMEPGLRRAIAGLPNTVVPNWPWFGNMQSNWEFQPVVQKHYLQISKALDSIPLREPVSRSHFMDFISKFVRAFPNGRHGIGVASRMLAMKRPDYFVCLSGKNKSNLCDAFGIKNEATLNYDRYWDEVCCRIQDSVWWNAPMPLATSDRRIWATRAAMLDVLYYKPDVEPKKKVPSKGKK